MHGRAVQYQRFVRDLLFILEAGGTLAFSVSGALLAVRKRFDFFGVLVLASVTAMGGGIMRDLICGIHPPLAFQNLSLLGLALGGGVVTFFFYRYLERAGRLLNLFDAIGLGLFTMTGVNIGLQNGLTLFPCILLGLLTGVGGGVGRDLLANRSPFILQKELYASVSLVGGLVFFALIQYMSQDQASYLASGLIILVRLLAVKFKLELPVPSLEERRGPER